MPSRSRGQERGSLVGQGRTTTTTTRRRKEEKLAKEKKTEQAGRGDVVSPAATSLLNTRTSHATTSRMERLLSRDAREQPYQIEYRCMKILLTSKGQGGGSRLN
ncbi:hypothetical protein TEQG_03263 [Trichophyton equinum CBS 127.97]|uniref:Uncharacterized protein n=1 Tax=Trichophyton equinum (strain ATCC MYA-4606 / CBS 127.97) TaxID=559882 RepID=F2PQR5_TRIEC|nr:hypothetical protein TEQG_03263 [Trichophyton equinum CBS 127.97]